MNKIFFVLAIFFAFFLFTPSYAEINESTITINVSKNTDKAPDCAKIKFYVENSGTKLTEIKTKNDTVINNAINEIKKKLASNEQIKTISYSVKNIYAFKNGVRTFQKYQVTNGFEVKLKELDKISDIIKIATDTGVNRIDSINFSIEEGDNTCNELMASAIKVAKTRGDYLAQAAGSQILKVKSINSQCSLSSSYTQPKLYANVSKTSSTDSIESAASALDVIEPGTISVRASVNITYYLK